MSDPAPPGARSPWLSVLVPAYNEEAQLADSVATLLARLDQMGIDAEIMIVNDASRDRTSEIANALAAQNPRVRAIHHTTNLNIGGGFVSGVRHARGEWMILIPADLALDLDDLQLYFRAAASADVVVGVCPQRGDYTWQRTLISRLNVLAIRTLFGMTQQQFNYISMYRVTILQAMQIEYWRSAFFFAEVLIKAKSDGARLVEVSPRYRERVAGSATGARASLVARTAADLLRYWPRWLGAKLGDKLGAPGGRHS